MAPTSFWVNLKQSLGLAKAEPSGTTTTESVGTLDPTPASPAKPAKTITKAPSKRKTSFDLKVEKFIVQLKHDNPDMRRSAAWQLGKLKPPPVNAVSALTDSAEKDPNEFVRKSAQWALKVIVGK